MSLNKSLCFCLALVSQRTRPSIAALTQKRAQTSCIRMIHLISTRTFFFLKDIIHVWKRQDSLRREIEVLTTTSSWRRSSGRCRVQPHRLLAPFPHSSRAILAIRSIRWGEGDRLQAMRLIELRGQLGDPRSRLLKSGDGERGFAFTRKNLCHSFNGAAHRHPAFLRDCTRDSIRSVGELILSFAYQVARVL